MRFLVEIAVELPDELRDPECHRRKELLAAEVELRRPGAIERIWRISGGLRNVGLWQAADATELHELISSLPLSPWPRADVTPLAEHPVVRALREREE